MKFLVGADPEMFVKDKATGLFVSGHDMVPGSKEDPYPVEDGAVQVDGTALEFNINPAATADQFVHNITSVIKQLRGMVPEGLDVVSEPVAKFDPEYFNTQVPDSAKELGCDPDFDAWAMEVNDPPDNTQPMRTGAGHIHIGWTEGMDPDEPQHFETCASIARQLDYYLGLNSLLWDGDHERRSMYGKAGCFRPKPYGMEYRVLSNKWLKNEHTMRWVYSNALKAVNDMTSGKRCEDEHGDAARDIINNSRIGSVATYAPVLYTA